MDFLDLFHITVFPELVTISQFNIGISLLIIMPECRKIKILVLQEVIVVGAVPAVAVAEQNIPPAASQGKDRGIFKSDSS